MAAPRSASCSPATSSCPATSPSPASAASLIRTGKASEGSLTLVFGTDPLELRQWVVTDAQQRQTRVSLYDIAPGGPFPDSLFTYQGQNPIQSGG